MVRSIQRIILYILYVPFLSHLIFWVNLKQNNGHYITSDPLHGSHGDWKTWKMKMVMEKSWNVKNWPKVIEFCDSVMEFYQFCPPKLYQFFFFTTKKLNSDLESPHL